ncbi:MAG: PAS domain-containing protein [Alphaproteobacteria bacterium]|nr:PAS domain-containing protein [Alphaproteobacteria bacterium]
MAPAFANAPTLSELPKTADARLAALLSFWLSCQDDAGGIPNREQLTPFTLRPWLGHISIYQVADDGRDFRVRLEGTKVTGMTGEDWTNRRASEVDARFGSTLVHDMAGTVATGASQILPIRIFQHKFKAATRLLFPVRATPNGPVDQVFLALYLDRAAAN